MSFVSFTFLAYFAGILSILALTSLLKQRGQFFRDVTLLVASYVFYAWWDWRFCMLMLFMTIVTYSASKMMKGKYRKIAMIAGITIPLLVLAVFKYMGFFLDSFKTIFGITDLVSLKIILPVGISFYTFQSVSYVIDTYRGKTKPENLFHVALYISFFPVVLSGPIVKSYVFMPELHRERKVTRSNLEIGLQIFVFGMFKKAVLADRLSVFVNDVYSAPVAFSSLSVILAVTAYSLQIYFDFSGYSDMAIGCAKCMGYEIPKNFNLPYLAKNPSEFWKRWHIALSSWFQEYLYYPLGGNRKGHIRTYGNLMTVMLISGLWHGAGWNFVVWGALHGIASCLHKLYHNTYKKNQNVRRGGTLNSIILNFTFVSLCWVFFRVDSFEVALQILSKAFIWSGGIQQIYMWLIVALAGEFLYVLWCWKKSKKENSNGESCSINAYYFLHDLNTIMGLTFFFLEIMLTIGLAYTGGSPFIYFQF